MRGILRLLAASALAASTLVLVAAPPAHALTGTYSCATLQAALTAALDNDVITLNNGGTLCSASFTLPAGKSITLRGAGAGPPTEGFDGTGLSARVLSGTDVHGTTITNLIFRDSTDTGPGGGAIGIGGDSSPTISNSIFLNNTTTGGGGAVGIDSSAVTGTISLTGNKFGASTAGTEPNHADHDGGAVAVLAHVPVVLDNNAFSVNTAGTTTSAPAGSGGGAFVQTSSNAATDDISLTNNFFAANKAFLNGGGAHLRLADLAHAKIDDNVFQDGVLFAETQMKHFGGGLSMARFIPVVVAGAQAGPSPQASVGPVSPDATQNRNLFNDNEVGVANGGSNTNVLTQGGGGEWSDTVAITSRDDRFVNNTVQGVADGDADGSTNFGAGLGVVSNNGSLVVRGENLVSAGNTLGVPANGSGIYAGLANSNTVTLNLFDSTVAGNVGGNGTVGPGVGGKAGDKLNLTNSILFGNVAPNGSTGNMPEIGGFNSGDVTATFSDVCDPGTANAFPGSGNKCIDPLLVDPTPGLANVHQTAGSVGRTIDAGSNALVPSSPALTKDYEGDARIIDGDLDGSAVVDMGADETPAVDLSITKTADPVFVHVNEQLTYTITVHNATASTAAAQNVSVSDSLPSGMELVSATSSQGSCSGTTTVTCLLGTIVAGGSVTITIKVIPRELGDRDNTAVVATSSPDVNPQNDVATAEVTVFGDGIQIRVTKTGPGHIPLRSSANFTISVTNGSDVSSTVDGVVIADPNCSTPQFQGGDQYPYNFQLDPGETWTFTCSATPTKAGKFVNTATVTATGSDKPSTSDTESASATVIVVAPGGGGGGRVPDEPALTRGNVVFERDTQTSGIADRTYTYGDSSDIVLLCDWNGDGRRTAGAFRNGTWFLRNTVGGGAADVAPFAFGQAGDIPVCGHWQGNAAGIETPGVFRNGVFYLRNSNSSGVADLTIFFGTVFDRPIVGDWTGDGTDKPGVVRNGQWFLRFSSSSGGADVSFFFGNASDLPVVGDWDADIVDTAAVYRTGQWFLRNSNSAGAPDTAFAFGDVFDHPLAWH